MRAFSLAIMLLLSVPGVAAEPLLPHQQLLERETFWDNRDWDWYKANIPFFECPDADIQTTYYYRWELVTKHLTYGSPNTGYLFTEFIDRPFWSGTYGAISCPAGLQLYEVRWLRDPCYARDYARYWFRTPGAQPRRYSTWLADAIWAVDLVHPNKAFTTDLLPDLVKNYEGWEKERFDKDVGLFWQTGHDDGMEYNINSRQTRDPNRGAPAYRPTINSYMRADAWAIARIAIDANEDKIAADYVHKAGVISKNFDKMWDPKRKFFFPLARRDETADGFTVKARSLTYQTGRFAGNAHGRELIGYVPWQFGHKGPDYDVAWKVLMEADGFAAKFGPTTVERKDPLFKISPTCCWWSGNSWPYATSQTLMAMANIPPWHNEAGVTNADYVKLLTTFAKTHRKDGKPYIAEACDPDTGSWKGHDSSNHSEHYFHSSFCDLVITGLVGLNTDRGPHFFVSPLAPPEWDYFALDNLPYRGHLLTILWDRTGKRYGKGVGFHLWVDGKEVASSKELGRLYGKVDAVPEPVRMHAVNFAVNNDGTYYPRVTASFTAEGTTPAKAVDGNYWYHIAPPNRWSCVGSTNASDWLAVDLGTKRKIHTATLYFLDDETGIVPPERFDLEYWDGKQWAAIPNQTRALERPTGRRANIVHFPELETARVRAVLHHAKGGKAGLTEFELWGDAKLPVEPPPHPAGNLACNSGDKPFPKASASYTSRFDKAEEAVDGKLSFTPSTRNRWTSYESPNDTDWLAVDFGAEKEFNRIELAIFDDRGGVQAPAKYEIEYWDGRAWGAVREVRREPVKPTGGIINEVRFDRVRSSKVRVVFTHAGKARSGVTEILIWND
jgi:mannosylglycerate hydrolase MGH1-like protein/F5/8 type C domain-containing protein/glycosyl hydrolase family 65